MVDAGAPSVPPLLGYETFAHYRARRRHGEDAGGRARLARSGLAPARTRALATATSWRRWRQAQGGNFRVRRLGLAYYAEKLRKLKCDVDEASVQTLPAAQHIIEAAFYTADKLFGLTFERRTMSRSGSRRAGLGRAQCRRPPSRPCSSADYFRAQPPSAAAPG